jgi:phospholipid/cholesterol/gamma-HCH transport system substrate-binding protein
MKKNFLETLVGSFIIITAVIFIAFIYNSANSLNKEKGQYYHLKAKFQDISGIIKGSDVNIAGINVGEVESTSLDPKTYEAVVTLKIKDKILVPTDSRVSIISSGFVGNKFISIDPGPAETFLKNGESILYTNSALNIESLIGKFMYYIGDKTDK